MGWSRHFWALVRVIRAALAWWHIYAVFIGGGIVTAITAIYTNWIQPFGPIGWVIAGLLSAFSLAIILLVVGIARERWVRSAIFAQMHERPRSINPLDGHFERIKIQIADFYSPFPFTHQDKNFTDCHMVGPAVVFFTGAVTLDAPQLFDCDFVVVKDGQFPVGNIIVFNNIVIRRCSFYRTTFLIPKANIPVIQRLGVNWITDLPPPAPQAEQP